MKSAELIEEIGDHEVNGGCGSLWSTRDKKWISTSDLVDEKNFIATECPGGDTFVHYAKDAAELAVMAQKAIDGDYNDTGDEQIRLIVQDGQKKTVKVTLQ